MNKYQRYIWIIFGNAGYNYTLKMWLNIMKFLSIKCKIVFFDGNNLTVVVLGSFYLRWIVYSF